MRRTRGVFFFNDTATTEIYTLSLHDALPISAASGGRCAGARRGAGSPRRRRSWLFQQPRDGPHRYRSEEHTSELQSRQYLVCRLLLEKKNTIAYREILTHLLAVLLHLTLLHY